MQGYRIYPAYPTYQQVQYTIAIEDDAKKDAYSYKIFETQNTPISRGRSIFSQCFLGNRQIAQKLKPSQSSRGSLFAFLCDLESK